MSDVFIAEALMRANWGFAGPRVNRANSLEVPGRVPKGWKISFRKKVRYLIWD